MARGASPDQIGATRLNGKRAPHLWYLVAPPGQTRQTRQFEVFRDRLAPGMALAPNAKRAAPVDVTGAALCDLPWRQLGHQVRLCR